jgi:hypothetical protein
MGGETITLRVDARGDKPQERWVFRVRRNPSLSLPIYYISTLSLARSALPIKATSVKSHWERRDEIQH